MPIKIRNTGKRNWKPADGTGWTVDPKGRQSKNVIDMRMSEALAEAQAQRIRNEYFQKKGSDVVKNARRGGDMHLSTQRVLFNKLPLAKVKGAGIFDGDDFRTLTDQSHWEAAINERTGYAEPDYTYYPGTAEKLMDQWGTGDRNGPPGVFVPREVLRGLDPSFGQSGEQGLMPKTANSYGEWWYGEPEDAIRVWDTTPIGTQMHNVRRTRADFRGAQNLKELGKISAKEAGIAARDERVRIRRRQQDWYDYNMPKNANPWGQF